MGNEITREEIFAEIKNARERRKSPDLSKKTLRNIDLRGENLLGVNLQKSVAFCTHHEVLSRHLLH